jgi:uncharacterized protein (TIGR00369 family)
MSAAVRDQWVAEYEARQRVLLAGVGMGAFAPELMRSLTGLQLMQAMLAGEAPYPSIAHTLDFALMSASEGSAVFQGTPQSKHLNPIGTVHGGWYATLLDSALGCAVHTMMPKGRAFTTAELSVNLVRGASLTAGPLRAIGTVLHCGRQLATAEGKILDADGRLYAHATTTCLVFEMK